MKTGHVSQYFSGVAAKRLRPVEVNPRTSNQHEFNGVNGLRAILGEAGGRKVQFDAKYIYLTDDEPDPVIVDSTVTWYDSRINDDTRAAEYRLYYPSSSVMERAETGDLLVVAKRQTGTLLIVVVDKETTAENQMCLLFGLQDVGEKYEIKTEQQADNVELGFVGRFILEQIGVEIEETDSNYLELMLHKFDGQFPSTKVFSSFARGLCQGVSPSDDSDFAIITWMEREETLFRTLERHLVGARLQQGFGDGEDNVDQFVSLSLSVHNRRKSRVGQALENHLEAIFQSCSVQHSRTKKTENNSKPDFLFPGVAQYHASDFPVGCLTVLGVKTTCKDRWRQVISEAHKITQKHLFTLEPGISENQTNEMRSVSLQLVIPQALHSTYSTPQRSWLITLADFIQIVLERQARSA